MEFEEIMGKFKAELETPENMAKLKRGERWLYSIDNDKVHQGADLERVGIQEEDIWPHPALSSDMHKVVENVHAWLEKQMQEYIRKKGAEKLDTEDCKQHLKDLFDNGYKVESIQANVRSLPWTYWEIWVNEGGYIAPGLR